MNNFRKNNYEVAIDKLYEDNDALHRTIEEQSKTIDRLEKELATKVLANAHTFTYYGYTLYDLFLLADVCKSQHIHPEDIRKNTINLKIAYTYMSERLHRAIDDAVSELEPTCNAMEQFRSSL